MSTKKMLIDATHAEEVRVAVVDGNRLEELDFETTSKKQHKGSIFLAKVIRVEPSLQAAFVEYGGNRHGFLPFSEIHPDYYSIPIDDRKKLMEEYGRLLNENKLPEEPEEEAAETSEESSAGDATDTLEGGEESSSEDVEKKAPSQKDKIDDGDDDRDEARNRARIKSKLLQSYKIQEVIKRNQIMLIQVVKEERGNKGAAITTYLSIPGRYSVLMPNAGRSISGISRKISSAKDRQHLRSLLGDLEVADGMGVIIRTAGMQRSKAEIKKDYEYLLGVWDEIRTITMESIAPKLVYQESDLIRRAVRDMYSRDIAEVLVEGEEGYRLAKACMKKMMPSHAARVKQYKDEKSSLFQAYAIESQVDEFFNPEVKLPSGGYVVFHVTEALVTVDVNSGKAIRERHIKETALKTNLEAADEIARQLRLRDLAGLVVVDFIDMDENRHIMQVERRLKEAMKHDRAQVRIGRISSFGLLELSRQRLRPSILETSGSICSTCKGSGYVRSVESGALSALRAIERAAIEGHAAEVIAYMPTTVAFYLLNNKRAALTDIEARLNISATISRDDHLIVGAHRIEIVRAHPKPAKGQKAVQTAPSDDLPPQEDIDDEITETPEFGREDALDVGASPRRSRRRRRGKGGRTSQESASSGDESMPSHNDGLPTQEGISEGGDRKRRRRNRRRRRGGSNGAPGGGESGSDGAGPVEFLPPTPSESAANNDSTSGDKPASKKKSRGWLQRILQTA